MTDPVSSIPNLGPASEASFARAGITCARALREMGADAAYLALIVSGTAPHFIGYYALVMGLQGRPWNDCRGDEKIALRARFDAIKAQAAASPASETSAQLPVSLRQAMDVLGVVKARPTPNARP